MRESLLPSRTSLPASRAWARAFAAALVLATLGCQDAAAPALPTPDEDAPLAAQLSASGWDAKVLPPLPDDGNVFGPNRRAEAMAINDKGTIVGFGERSYFLSDSTQPCEGLSAFIYRNGVLVDPFVRRLDTCLWNAVATDVNNNDEVVGWALDASGSKVAWVWSAAHGLRTLRGFGYDLAAFAINDAGTIVGFGGNAMEIHAMVWSSAGTIDLHPSGAWVSRALDINDAGAIVGIVDGVATQWLPDGSVVTGGDIIYGGRTAPFTIPQPAIGMNDAGQVVFNRFTSAGPGRAVLWNAPAELPRRLDAPPPVVSDISDAGRTVGYASSTPYTSKAGVATPLPIPPGFSEAWTHRVNRCGQVVGTAKVGTTTRAVTWRQRGCD